MKTIPFDTTNDWGFGGSSGTEYQSGPLRLQIGKTHYRHSPSSNFRRMYINSREFSYSKVKPNDLNKVKEIVVVGYDPGYKDVRYYWFAYFEGYTEYQAVKTLKANFHMKNSIRNIKTRTLKIK